LWSEFTSLIQQKRTIFTYQEFWNFIDLRSCWKIFKIMETSSFDLLMYCSGFVYKFWNIWWLRTSIKVSQSLMDVNSERFSLLWNRIYRNTDKIKANIMKSALWPTTLFSVNPEKNRNLNFQSAEEERKKSV